MHGNETASENYSILGLFHPYHIGGLKRLGNKHDGGYVVHLPSLRDAHCLMTYGVGYDVGFERDFYCHTNRPVLAFDPTMKDPGTFIQKIRQGRYLDTIKQLRRLALWQLGERTLPKFRIAYIEEGIANENRGPYNTLGGHLKEFNLLNKKIVLKIDIDGGEYAILRDEKIYMLLDDCVQIIIEFHDAEQHMADFGEVLPRLFRTHTLIHIHGNNYAEPFRFGDKSIPQVLEVTLLHNRYMPERRLSEARYPIDALDRPCFSRKNDLPLDFFRVPQAGATAVMPEPLRRSR